MEYIFITNNKQVAGYAQASGVDRIMVDLEMLGKPERQGHLNTVISGHTLNDVASIRQTLIHSKLQVRINPINENSKNEIDQVIGLGADVVMLPMFTTAEEVHKFVGMVNGRAKIQLLLETPQALVRIDDILSVPGIDELYIGLNDLHLGLGLRFMFEPLSGGIIDYLASKIIPAGIRFGFGGIARLGCGTLDSSLILSEHLRLNSSMVILSRDFHQILNNPDFAAKTELSQEVRKINHYISLLQEKGSAELLKNQTLLRDKVKQIVAESQLHTVRC